MKKVIAILMAVMLCAALAVTAFAAQNPTIRDHADLLTASEEKKLQKKLDQIGEEYNVYLYVLTMESINGSPSLDYAEMMFWSNGLGYGEDQDGILLLVSMEERDWAIYTNGVGHDAVSNSEADEIGNRIAPLLKDEEYAAAFETFAEECEEYIDIEINGAPFPFLKVLFISLAVGAVVALIVTGIMKGQLKSVRMKAGASDYVRPGSMKVTLANEFFLYRTVTRRAKPKSSSSSGGGGGGGSRSGGSSGKF